MQQEHHNLSPNKNWQAKSQRYMQDIHTSHSFEIDQNIRIYQKSQKT
jgi:hypothetical protein